MWKPYRISALSCGFLLLAAALTPPTATATPLAAHQPTPMRSSEAALRLYEAAQLRALQQRCEAVSVASWGELESYGLREGWLWRMPVSSPGSPVARYIGVSTHKRLAWSVSYQWLDGSGRLHLKLALPRDYARCRIATDAQGRVRLEVVTKETLTSSTAADTLKSLLDAKGETGACGEREPGIEVFHAGEANGWSACTPARRALAAQVKNLSLSLFGELPVYP